jgi:DNA-binding NarL/FixJ family response regulator
MPSPTVVIAQNNSATAAGLANDLQAYFVRVAIADSAVELPALLARHEARLAVLDLELVDLEAVHQLAQQFSDLAIVCTHRSPDERMWMASLNAGAVEFCHPQDVRSILRAWRTGSRARLPIAA